MYLACTEINTGSASESSAILFKRTLQAAFGKAGPPVQKAVDEEKQASGTGTGTGTGSGTPVSGAAPNLNVISGAPSMTDIFSWQHIEYTISLSGGRHKRLLDDVSGYVAPGKLTALMGATGAGKVRCEFDCRAS